MTTVSKDFKAQPGFVSQLAEACGLPPDRVHHFTIDCELESIVHITAELYGTVDLEEFGWKRFFKEQPPKAGG